MHERATFNALHKINQRAWRRLREPIFENTNCDWGLPIGSTTDPLYVLIRRMKSSTSPHRVVVLLTLALAAPLGACGSSTTGMTGGAGNVLIEDANNYTATSSLTIPAVETQAATDLSISWTGITQNLLCHPAGSIDNVAFLRIGNMTQMDVENKLAKGQLVQTEVTTYREFHTAGATSTMLSDLSFGTKLDPATDYVVAPSTQYLLLFTTGTVLGVGAQSMVFLSPSTSSTNTTVAAPNPCGTTNFLSFAATLSTMPVSIPAKGPWKIDWSQITKDSFGQTIDFTMTILDKVEVGFFQGKQPSDIQTDFLNVEQDATSLYTYAIPSGQTYVDLMSTPTTGGAFPGFTDTSGTYAIAVLCTKCSVPAPVVFSILQPQ
jgi:hypothetical protein